MVFKLRQPPQEPRRRMSAREVAKDLGVRIEVVMAAIGELGEFVQSPASKLEEPVIRRLYAAMGGRYEPARPKPSPAWDRKGRIGQVSPAARSTKDSTSEDGTNWHSASRDDWWETQGDVAPSWEVGSWKLYGFTESERDSWIAHGLRPGQVKDAVAYREAGLMPPDLVKVVAGWTVLRRLRAGDPPIDVLRLLRGHQVDGQVRSSEGA